MDNKKLILFIICAVVILLGWEKFFPNKEMAISTVNNIASDSNGTLLPTNSNNFNTEANNNIKSKNIIVTTDLVKATINNIGGDLKELELLKYKDFKKQDTNYYALQNDANKILTTQTGLVSNDDNINSILPNHKSEFQTESNFYYLAPNQNSITVKLHYSNSEIGVDKLITFYKNSYLIKIQYQIISYKQNLSNVVAYWRLVRDQKSNSTDSKFVHTFNGAIAYNDQSKSHKIKIDTIVKANNSQIDDIPNNTNNGWAGFVEHYFSSIWLLNTKDQPSVCTNSVQCSFAFNYLSNHFVTSGFNTQIPTIIVHKPYQIGLNLFVGPDQYQIFKKIAPSLERTKDYGIFYIFATPLFWLLIHIFSIVQNWGWSIILLTLTVKLILYPLTATSFRSMAKLRSLTPKLKQLKDQYHDDKVTMQKEIMQLYRKEKVNPVGGCLPMILQIPVFIGLYWALLCSVELRQASFLWIQDLSKPDPLFILPVLMGASMFIQTFFNPPASDPVQAKLMKIMPLMFSVMFFFFPSGLVLYWIANNTLSILQQWYINKSIKKNRC